MNEGLSISGNVEAGGISREEFEKAQEMIKRLSEYYDARMIGQQNLKFVLTTSILADGHILLESVPGLAKTMAAKVIFDAVAARFSRIGGSLRFAPCRLRLPARLRRARCCSCPGTPASARSGRGRRGRPGRPTSP